MHCCTSGIEGPLPRAGSTSRSHHAHHGLRTKAIPKLGGLDHVALPSQLSMLPSASDAVQSRRCSFVVIVSPVSEGQMSLSYSLSFICVCGRFLLVVICSSPVASSSEQPPFASARSYVPVMCVFVCFFCVSCVFHFPFVFSYYVCVMGFPLFLELVHSGLML